MTLVKGNNRMIDGAAVNVRDFGAVGDGVTDDTAAFSDLRDGVFNVPDGTYLINNGTVDRSVRLVLSNNAVLKSTTGTTNIYGVLEAINFPVDLRGGGTISVNQYQVNVGSGQDFDTIQEAIDFIPSTMWQRFHISVADGTYDEEVYINNKHAATVNIGDPIPGEHSGLFLSGNSSNPENVKVTAFLAVSCGGATYTPQIANCQITGVNTKTNEGSSIEFYGCTAGAVTGVQFRAPGADKALMSYSSSISEENNDYGDNVYNYAFCTKHTGTISINAVTDLGILKSSRGSLIKKIGLMVSGEIYASDISQFKWGEIQPWNVYGVGCGSVYEQLTKRQYGPMVFADNPATHHTYFNSLEDFESFVNGGTITKVLYEGMQVETTGDQTADLWMRRVAGLAAKEINSSQIFVLGCRLLTLTGDQRVEFGIGNGSGQPKVRFVIEDINVYGEFERTDGSILRTTIMPTADILGRNAVFRIDITPNFDNINSPGVEAFVTFQVLDSNFNGNKGTLDIDQDAETNFDWHISTGGTTGGASINLAELKVFRSPHLTSS
ncbi:hypothetical protein VPHD148_0061 [Vibrio phage D148]